MWVPIGRNELTKLLVEGENECEPAVRRLWSSIRISASKWQLHPWGDEGDGFWVIGLIGTRVIWYNDIEDGFNVSSWSTFGEIDEYWCNQDTFYHTLNQLYLQLLGYEADGGFWPPETQ